MSLSTIAKYSVVLAAWGASVSARAQTITVPATANPPAPLPEVTDAVPDVNPNIAPPPEISETEAESQLLEPVDLVPWRSGSALARGQKRHWLGAGIGYDTGMAFHVMTGMKILNDLWAEAYGMRSTIGYFGTANKVELRLKYFVGQSFNIIGGFGRREIHLRGVEKYNGEPVNYKGTDLGFVYGFGNQWYFARGYSIALEWYDGFSPVKRKLSDEDYERNFMNRSIYTSVFKFTFVGMAW